MPESHAGKLLRGASVGLWDALVARRKPKLSSLRRTAIGRRQRTGMRMLSDRDNRAQTVGRLAAVLAASLPLVGLVSLILRSELDPRIENYRIHFVVFGFVGTIALILGYAAGEAANRRGDARVLLLSLAFMATGGFLALHALGTKGVLFNQEYSGFMVAIPVGLLVSAVFAGASAFVDVRPSLAAALIRRRALLRTIVFAAMAAWFLWTVAKLPPLRGQVGEAATDRLVVAIAIIGT